MVKERYFEKQISVSCKVCGQNIYEVRDNLTGKIEYFCTHIEDKN